MGADGGVCWIPLKKPAKYKRVRELLLPFWQLTDMNSESSNHEEANYLFLKDNPIISEPNYLVGYYSSFKDDALINLVDILSEESQDLCSNSSLTFEEFILDLKTRPFTNGTNSLVYLEAFKFKPKKNQYDCLGNKTSLLEALVSDSLYYDNESHFQTIINIFVKDWQFELNQLLDILNYSSAETWT